MTAIHNIDHFYPQVKQPNLDLPLVQPRHIYPLIDTLKQQPELDVRQVGESFLGQPIYKIKLGHGPITVLAWSQMHGDEPTATAALFDLINFFLSPQHSVWNQNWQAQITLHIVPMLNPDGADLATRQNAQSIDINRDARVLQSPEGQLLDRLVKQLQPDYGFNLHDQRRWFSVAGSANTAAMSFLAPAFDKEKNWDASRTRAMQMIVQMNRQIQQHICGHVGRYDDTWSYRCFGDAIAAQGVSTILVESGGYPGDPNRQVARKMNFLALLTALESICSADHEKHSLELYEAIPMNREDGCMDLVIRGLNCQSNNRPGYWVDVLIKGDKIEQDKAAGMIVDIGDMQHLHGYQQLDAHELSLQTAKAYPLTEPLTLDDESYMALLAGGYGYFCGDGSLLTNHSTLPVEINPNSISRDNLLRRDSSATFFMLKHEKLHSAVVKGRIILLA